jgi:hypothetical protein
VHLDEERPRHGDVEVRLHDAIQVLGIERTDLDLVESVSAGSPQLGGESCLSPRPLREQGADGLVPQASRRIGERARRGRIEPLDVVDRENHGNASCETADRAEQCHPDRTRVGCRPIVFLLQDERQRQRTALGCGERLERLVEHRIE